MAVSLTLFTTQCFAGKCPKPEVLAPCKCIIFHKTDFQIHCDTDETVDIKKILTKASEDSDVVNTIFQLNIKSAKITEFPEEATGKLKFSGVFIDVKSLQRIHSKAFASSKDTMKNFCFGN